MRVPAARRIVRVVMTTPRGNRRARSALFREFVAVRQQRRPRMAQGVRFKSLDSCIVLPEYPQTNRWYGSCSFFLLPKLSRQNG
jgi:hypothetical protein